MTWLHQSQASMLFLNQLRNKLMTTTMTMTKKVSFPSFAFLQLIRFSLYNLNNSNKFQKFCKIFALEREEDEKKVAFSGFWRIFCEWMSEWINVEWRMKKERGLNIYWTRISIKKFFYVKCIQFENYCLFVYILYKIEMQNGWTNGVCK